MLLPMVRRISPGRPSCENPRSAKSPMPTIRTVVRSLGRPSVVNTAASSSMNRWGTACPAPEPPMSSVLPSRTSPTASRTSMTLAHGMYPPAFGLSVWPRNSDDASVSRKRTASALSSARPNARAGFPQSPPALLAVDQVGGHVGHGDARGHGVDPDPARPELARQRAGRPMSPAFAADSRVSGRRSGRAAKRH